MVNNLFSNEKIKHKLRTLKTKRARRTKLTIAKGCAVNFALSWSIGCRDERQQLPTDASFQLTEAKNQTKYNLKVRLL